MIHPTAVVHPNAQLDSSVEVGPYAVIDEHVCLGARCRVGAYVHLTGNSSIGEENIFHSGCVIGDAPQDLKYKGEPTRLRIGTGNVFREHVTIHRSNSLDEDTVIGSRSFFMAHSHVGHNSHVGDNVIIANGALIGGHVSIGSRAFISGNCLLHQFVRVGTLALMQGGAGISKDLPPYCVAWGQNALCGLNTVGLRRAGISSEDRLELRRLYQALFRGGKMLQVLLAEAETAASSDSAKALVRFVKEAKRGICADAGRNGCRKTVAQSGGDPRGEDAPDQSLE